MLLANRPKLSDSLSPPKPNMLASLKRCAESYQGRKLPSLEKTMSKVFRMTRRMSPSKRFFPVDFFEQTRKGMGLEEGLKVKTRTDFGNSGKSIDRLRNLVLEPIERERESKTAAPQARRQLKLVNQPESDLFELTFSLNKENEQPKLRKQSAKRLRYKLV